MTATLSSGPASLRSGLDRKLAAYLLAGGSVFVAAQEGRAEIVYSGPQHIVIGPGTTYNLDVNADGITDYTFSNEFIGKPFNEQKLKVTPAGSNLTATDTTTDDPAALPAGTPLPGTQTFSPNSDIMAGWKFNNSSGFGDWFDANNLFLGLQFDIGGQIHYGWAELSVTSDDTVTATLEGWAYNTDVGGPIVTGQIASPIPEPSSLFVLAVGAAGVAAYRRWRRQPGSDAA